MNITLVERPAVMHGDGKRYEVFVDDKSIGEVYQTEICHERKPKGSRIVTRRWYSQGWVYRQTGGRRSRCESRWRGVADLLARINNTADVWKFETEAKSAKVVAS